MAGRPGLSPGFGEQGYAMNEDRKSFFDGAFGRYLLPGIILQSVLIGGGYATGREIIEFGAKYGSLGWISGLMIFAGFALMAFLTFETARRFRAYDYRTLVTHIVGPFWFLFDILYVLLAVLIIAIMAAATGEILNATVGLNYWVGVILITLVVAVLNFYGEYLIERFETYGTIALFAGFILFGILVISTRFDQITNVFRTLDQSFLPEVGLGSVIWSGIIYVGYNLAVFPAALFTVKRQRNIKETLSAGFIAGVLMTLPWFLTYFSVMGFYPAESVMNAKVPWLQMLTGYGNAVVIVFGIVVGWTLIETATGMIHALNERISHSLIHANRRPLSDAKRGAIALVTLALSMVLAQVGIIDLIATGYTIMGYGMIAVFAVPLIARGFWFIVTGKCADSPALADVATKTDAPATLDA